jgi:hypothetical protein
VGQRVTGATGVEWNRNRASANTSAGARSVGRGDAQTRIENEGECREGAGARTIGQIDELGER